MKIVIIFIIVFIHGEYHSVVGHCGGCKREIGLFKFGIYGSPREDSFGNGKILHRFGCTKFPSLSCLLFGTIGCQLLCDIEAALYGCTSYEAICRKRLYCECHEVYQLPVDKYVPYENFSDMSFDTLWHYRFQDNASSKALLNKIKNQWKIEDEIKEILNFPHLSGQEIKDLFIEQLPDDKDVQGLEIFIHGQKDRILKSGDKLQYDQLSLQFKDLFKKVTEQAGTIKYDRKWTQYLDDVDSNDELKFVMQEINYTENEKLKQAIKSYMVKKGLSADDFDVANADSENHYYECGKKLNRKWNKYESEVQVDDLSQTEDEDKIHYCYDPPTFKSVTLTNGPAPATIYDDEDHIIEVSVVNDMMRMSNNYKQDDIYDSSSVEVINNDWTITSDNYSQRKSSQLDKRINVPSQTQTYYKPEQAQTKQTILISQQSYDTDVENHDYDYDDVVLHSSDDEKTQQETIKTGFKSLIGDVSTPGSSSNKINRKFVSRERDKMSKYPPVRNHRNPYIDQSPPQFPTAVNGNFQPEMAVFTGSNIDQPPSTFLANYGDLETVDDSLKINTNNDEDGGNVDSSLVQKLNIKRLRKTPESNRMLVNEMENEENQGKNVLTKYIEETDEDNDNDLIPIPIDEFEGPIIDDPDLSCFLFGNTGCHHLCHIQSLLYGCQYESECANNVYCLCGEIYKFPDSREVTYSEFVKLSLDDLWNYRFKKTKPARRILKQIENNADLAAKVRDILSYPHLSGNEVRNLLEKVLIDEEIEDHDDIDDLKMIVHGKKDEILDGEEHLQYDNLSSHFPDLFEEIKQDVSKMKYKDRMKKILAKINDKEVLKTIMQAIHDTGNDALLRPTVKSFLEKAEKNAEKQRGSNKGRRFIGKRKMSDEEKTKLPSFKEVILKNGKEETTIRNEEDFILEVGLINDMIKFVDQRQKGAKNKNKNKKSKKGSKDSKKKKAKSEKQIDDSSEGEVEVTVKKSKKNVDKYTERETKVVEHVQEQVFHQPAIARGYFQRKTSITGSFDVIYKPPKNSDEDVFFEYHEYCTGTYYWEYNDGQNREFFQHNNTGSEEYTCDCHPDFEKPQIFIDFLRNPRYY